jgi:hypothetical protein
MKGTWVIPAIAVLVLSLPAGAKTENSSSTPAVACPVELTDLHVNAVRIKVRNTTGKKIVGLVFNAAFSDATERWKWLHWNYDDGRPLQEFGWTKEVNDGETKKLTWGWDLEHEHGGGVALVLTSILFADGSSWQDDSDNGACKGLWYNRHKKGFSRPVELRRRE